MKMLQPISVGAMYGPSTQFLPAAAIWRGVNFDGYGLVVWAEVSDNDPQAQYQFEVKAAGLYFEDALEFVGSCMIDQHPLFLYVRRMP